jgi:hypothetical protein
VTIKIIISFQISALWPFHAPDNVFQLRQNRFFLLDSYFSLLLGLLELFLQLLDLFFLILLTVFQPWKLRYEVFDLLFFDYQVSGEFTLTSKKDSFGFRVDYRYVSLGSQQAAILILSSSVCAGPPFLFAVTSLSVELSSA